VKLRVLLNIIFLSWFAVVTGQTRSELEDQRKKTLEEITYVDNLLKNTEKQKNESINSLRILGKKVNLRESIISGMGQEINLLNERIDINRLAIDMMESDLQVLKEDYSRAIINSYKSKKINPEIVYIFSARDFNQGYKRLKYLQQISKFRRNESEVISALKQEIESTKEKLEIDLGKISDLRHNEVEQKEILQGEQQKKTKTVKNLGNKEKQLKKELEEKKIIANRIERAIARIIDEERSKSIKNELTPEQKLIGDDFSVNKGRLPWPVEKGIITNHFGVHKHPVLKYVTENNFGIEITSSGRNQARSIFKGEVTAITAISGANMTIIIKHGNYYSVYTNLVNVKVKKGEKVDTKQIIGEVYQDPSANYNSTIKFMIFEKQYLDPELWIAKN
jgi:septal ring factor EnvC (AmiA/AmiB activator)